MRGPWSSPSLETVSQRSGLRLKGEREEGQAMGQASRALRKAPSTAPRPQDAGSRVGHRPVLGSTEGLGALQRPGGAPSDSPPRPAFLSHLRAAERGLRREGLCEPRGGEGAVHGGLTEPGQRWGHQAGEDSAQDAKNRGAGVGQGRGITHVCTFEISLWLQGVVRDLPG